MSATPCETAHRRVDARVSSSRCPTTSRVLAATGRSRMETVLRIWPRRRRDRLPSGRGSDDRCADGGTCWRQTLSARAHTDRGRSIHERSASPRLRETPVAATGRSVAVTSGRTTGWCSPPSSARRSTRATSCGRFRSRRRKRACPTSGCTRCAIVPPWPRLRREYTSRPWLTCWDTARSRSPTPSVDIGGVEYRAWGRPQVVAPAACELVSLSRVIRRHPSGAECRGRGCLGRWR